MKLFSIVILFGAVLTAAAQQVPPPKPKDAPPVISQDTLKRFWQADAAQQRAQRAVEQAEAAQRTASDEWQAAVKALNAVCGDKYEIRQDVPGQDPYCSAKAVQTEKK